MRISMVYGSGIYESTAAVSQNGNFSVEMSLPDFQPLVPTTALTLSLFNTPGESHSVENSEASATVDTKSPTALFNVEESRIGKIQERMVEHLPSDYMSRSWMVLGNHQSQPC